MRINLTVNQHPHEFDVEPRMLLVDVLRDRANTTSVKVGCDTGQCGACVVMLDGVSVKSCALLAVQADGSSIQTTEGLSAPGTMNPLQTAFQSAHAVQCGFCTPGMIMSLTDLLARTSRPTDEDVRAWLAGNLCRCTGYENVVRAVHTAVQLADSAGHITTETPLRSLYDGLVRALVAGDINTVVEIYHADAVLTTFEGIHTGHDALRSFYGSYLAAHPGLSVIATEKVFELGDSLYTESTLRTTDGVRHTYNTYVVRDGKITHHFAGVK